MKNSKNARFLALLVLSALVISIGLYSTSFGSNTTYRSAQSKNAPTYLFDGSSNTPVTSSTTVTTINTTTIAPFPVTLSANPTTVNATTPTTFTVSWSGGTAPYSLTLYASKTSSCSSLSAPVLSQSGITSTSVQVRRAYYPPGAYFCAMIIDANSNSALSNPVFVTINN